MTAIPSSLASRFNPPRQPRRLGRTIAATALLGIVAVAAWGIYRWATYPDVPEVNKVELSAAISFMGTDDFNRMLERHRLEYALAVVDRLGQVSFTELLGMMARRDDNRAQIARNIRAVKGYDQIGSRMFAIFLEKYYNLSPTERQAAMLAIIAIQQSQIATNPDEFALPTTDQFKRDMSRFLSRQPPRVQAMCGQFLIDVKRQRDRMGLPDPF